MRGRGSGFTLVELLVVISIVSVLLVLVSPMLRHAREQARITRCKNNLRQIHYAMLDYAEDYRDRLPDAVVLNNEPDDPRQLQHLLAEIVEGGGSGVFHCPSDQGYHEWWGGTIYFPYFGSSYQTRGDDKNFNYWLARGRVAGEYHPFGGEFVDYYPEPGRLGILRDGCGWHDLGYRSGIGRGSRAQCLFLDGHTEYFDRGRPWPYWARIW